MMARPALPTGITPSSIKQVMEWLHGQWDDAADQMAFTDGSGDLVLKNPTAARTTLDVHSKAEDDAAFGWMHAVSEQGTTGTLNDSTLVNAAINAATAETGGGFVTGDAHNVVALALKANVRLLADLLTFVDAENDRNIVSVQGAAARIVHTIIDGNGDSRHGIQLEDTMALDAIVAFALVRNTGAVGDGVRVGSANNALTNTLILASMFQNIGRNNVSIVSGLWHRVLGNYGDGVLQIETVAGSKYMAVVGNQFRNSNASLSGTRRALLAYVGNVFGKSDADLSLKFAGNADSEVIAVGNACLGGIVIGNGENLAAVANTCKFIDVQNPGAAPARRLLISNGLVLNDDEGASDPQVTPGAVDDGVVFLGAANTEQVQISDMILAAPGLSGIIARGGPKRVRIIDTMIVDDTDTGNYGIRFYNLASEDVLIDGADIKGFTTPVRLEDVTRPTLRRNEYHGVATPVTLSNCTDVLIEDRVALNLLGTNTFRAGSILIGSATWDPPSIAAGAVASTTVSVPGAKQGDKVVGVGHTALGAVDAILTGHVQAADTVRVLLVNHTGGALDVATGTVNVEVVVS